MISPPAARAVAHSMTVALILPLLLNALRDAADDRDGRPRLYARLPVPAVTAGTVRFLSPAIVQLGGAVTALAMAWVARVGGRADRPST